MKFVAFVVAAAMLVGAFWGLTTGRTPRDIASGAAVFGIAALVFLFQATLLVGGVLLLLWCFGAL